MFAGRLFSYLCQLFPLPVRLTTDETEYHERHPFFRALSRIPWLHPVISQNCRQSLSGKGFVDDVAAKVSRDLVTPMMRPCQFMLVDAE